MTDITMICSMIPEKNPDFGDLRIGEAPFTADLKPGDIVVAGKHRYEIRAVAVFVIGCAEYNFILNTFGKPLKIDGVWVWKSFVEDESCSKSVFME